MEMIPQGYPLWCALLQGLGKGEYEIGSGRVVGWATNLNPDDAANGVFAQPVVAFANETGEVYHVGFVEDSNFYLGDSRQEVEAMVGRYGEKQARKIKDAGAGGQ
jgi:hypothetical protein